MQQEVLQLRPKTDEKKGGKREIKAERTPSLFVLDSSSDREQSDTVVDFHRDFLFFRCSSSWGLWSKEKEGALPNQLREQCEIKGFQLRVGGNRAKATPVAVKQCCRPNLLKQLQTEGFERFGLLMS